MGQWIEDRLAAWDRHNQEVLERANERLREAEEFEERPWRKHPILFSSACAFDAVSLLIALLTGMTVAVRPEDGS